MSKDHVRRIGPAPFVIGQASHGMGHQVGCASEDVQRHRQKIGGPKILAVVIFPCDGVFGAWQGESQTLLFVRWLLPDLMPPTPLNHALDDDLAAVMQQHLFLPATPTGSQQSRRYTGTHSHKRYKEDCLA